MNLLEYQGKKLFSEAGIRVPSGVVVASGDDAAAVFGKFPSGVVVKAQVHAGGRGKAGGIRLARTGGEAAAAAKDILGMKIRECVVGELLLEEILDIDRELYMSLIVNNDAGNILFLFSQAGGMDIEDIARGRPESLVRWEIDDISSVREFRIRNVLRGSGMHGKVLADVASVAMKLFECFRKNDLLLAEINPLVVTKGGEIVAADAKVDVDDNALFRHDEFGAIPVEIRDSYERRAAEIGISYVQLTGSVGIIASGAGLAMNSMDILESRGSAAANFLETGGGITAKLISDSVGLLLSNPSVKGILVNLYGGVNPMVEAAGGVIDGLTGNSKGIPVVVKLLGNQQEEAWAILEGARIPTVKTVSTEEAVDLLLRTMEGRTEK